MKPGSMLDSGLVDSTTGEQVARSGNDGGGGAICYAPMALSPMGQLKLRRYAE